MKRLGDPAPLLAARVPADVAEELLADGVASRDELAGNRVGADLVAVLVAVPAAAATVVTLLQTPATLADLARRLRRKDASVSIEVRAPGGTLAVSFEEVTDDEAVASIVSQFLDEATR